MFELFSIDKVTVMLSPYINKPLMMTLMKIIAPNTAFNYKINDYSKLVSIGFTYSITVIMPQIKLTL